MINQQKNSSILFFILPFFHTASVFVMQKGTKSVIYWWKAYRKSGIEYIHIKQDGQGFDLWSIVIYFTRAIVGYVKFAVTYDFSVVKKFIHKLSNKIFFFSFTLTSASQLAEFLATLKTVSFYWISIEIFQYFCIVGIKI